MTELIILCAFAPLVFLPFPVFRRVTAAWGWTAIAIAALCHGYFIFLHAGEPQLWIPAACFLSVFVVNLLGQRYRRGLSTLAVLFVSQALLTKNLGYVLVLLALADTFLGAELFLSSDIEKKSRAVQSLYQSALSLLPAALGLLLRLDGSALQTCIVVTAALRLFSWPVSHWVIEISGNNKMFPTYIGIVSAFALWHIQTFLHPEIWAVVWLSLALSFSLGAKYTEVYAALSLGLFAINPGWGVLSICLWPLLAHPSFTVYIMALAASAVGMVLSDSLMQVLVPEASFALAGGAGALCARAFVASPVTRCRWYLVLLDGLFALVWAGLLVFFEPLSVPTPQPVGMAFAGAFVLVFVVGKLLASRNLRGFKALPALPPQIFSKELFGSEFMTEKRGAAVSLGPTRFRTWLFNAIESEMYMALLFGALGAFLIWGIK